MLDFIRAKGPKNEENGFNCRTRASKAQQDSSLQETHAYESVGDQFKSGGGEGGLFHEDITFKEALNNPHKSES